MFAEQGSPAKEDLPAAMQACIDEEKTVCRCGGMSVGDALFYLIYLGLHAEYFGMYIKRDWDGIDKSERHDIDELDCHCCCCVCKQSARLRPSIPVQ